MCWRCLKNLFLSLLGSVLQPPFPFCRKNALVNKEPSLTQAPEMDLVLILERPPLEPPVPPVRSYSPPSPLVNTQMDEDENTMLTQALEPEQEPEFCPCPFPHTASAAKRAHIVSPVETDVIDGTCSPLGDRRNLP